MSARYTLVTHETLFNAYLVSHFLYPGPFHCLDLNGKYIHQTAIKVTPMSAALFISQLCNVQVIDLIMPL